MQYNIRNQRKIRNIKLSELADKIGVDLNRISKWERGFSVPRKSDFIRLAKVFKCDPDKLIKGQKEYNKTITPGEGYTTLVPQKGQCHVLERIKPIQPNKLKLMDLFCGSGGLSYGFEMSNYFQTTLGIDLLPDRINTFHSNHPHATAIVADITKFPISRFYDYTSKPDIIVGGPPCQGFSSIRPFRKLTELDNRNSLIETFILIVSEIRPKWVLFENVVGLLTHGNGQVFNSLLENLISLGYTTDWRILNTAYYGLPQNRERLIVIANIEGKSIKWPSPTHYTKYKSMAGKRPQVVIPIPLFDQGIKPAVSVMDAIHDLPELMAGEEKSQYALNTNLSEYVTKMRNGCTKLTLHRATHHSNKMIEIIKLSGSNIANLPEGTVASGFSSCYSRLERDKPSTTITVNFIHPSSNRCIHPEQNRALSLREGARLQGFPDNFKFVGTRSQVAKQIGNAVPPILGEVLANFLKDEMC